MTDTEEIEQRREALRKRRTKIADQLSYIGEEDATTLLMEAEIDGLTAEMETLSEMLEEAEE